jgi:hypothetical protein
MGLGNRKIHYGAEINAPAWETWAEHLKIMNTLCVEFGIRFVAFLQPNPRPDSAELSGFFDKAAEIAESEPYIHTLSAGAADAGQIAREVKKILWNN